MAAVGETSDYVGDCPLGQHAIVVIAVTDKSVKFIDCNDKDKDFEWDKPRFLKFLKYAVAVEPKAHINWMPEPRPINWNP